MPEVSDPPEKVSSSTDSEPGDDDASTKATEENDSDTTMGSPDTKKEATSDAETEADDSDGKTQEEKDKESKEAEEAEKKRIEELKIKYKDWPLKDVKEPHENDVMYGRGGGTNHHPGNKRYRLMVESRKVKYVNSKRLDKPLVALEIIREWRAQLPPGRFLKHNDKTGCWDDVGDKKAREKTSQALREKAPQIRAQQEEEEKVSRIIIILTTSSSIVIIFDRILFSAVGRFSFQFMHSNLFLSICIIFNFVTGRRREDDSICRGHEKQQKGNQQAQKSNFGKRS